jgi:hypothetical protein
LPQRSILTAAPIPMKIKRGSGSIRSQTDQDCH